MTASNIGNVKEWTVINIDSHMLNACLVLYVLLSIILFDPHNFLNKVDSTGIIGPILQIKE